VDDHLETLTLPDGRTLAYAQWGDPTGRPIIALHGTPGCRLNRHPSNEMIAATGTRLITYDRPGYGRSDRLPGRRVVDCATDVAAIADAAGLETFAVTGGSGGGPHCLAVAAKLSERVTRAACIVGVAPYDVLGDAFYDGMDPQNVKEFGWALEGENRLQTELTNEAAGMLSRIDDDPATVLGEFDIPESDRQILSRPDIAAVMRQALREAVGANVWGWVDDDIAFTRPWGFDPASITVPTAVWWGATDVLVPPGHGEWLARTVPNAFVRVDTDGGHQADPDRHIGMLYPWLLDGADWTR
jgi:pimeloyl-ACP methyl ester carboxylesterase